MIKSSLLLCCIIVSCLLQYSVRTDGSGCLTTRDRNKLNNFTCGWLRRRFLRRYDPHLTETTTKTLQPSLPETTYLPDPTSQVNPPDAGTAQTEHPTTPVPPTTRSAPIAIPATPRHPLATPPAIRTQLMTLALTKTLLATPTDTETPQLRHSHRPTPHQDPTLPLRRHRPDNALHYRE